MATNTWITLAGQSAFAHLKTEMRLRVAKRLLDMTGVRKTPDETLYIDTSKLCSLFDLLGEVWTWFDGKERSQLTRSKNLDVALAKLVLRGVGHPLTYIKGCHHNKHGGKCSVCLELCNFVYYDELKPYDEWNEAMERHNQKKKNR